jgi:hypothetical protein
VDGIDIRFAVGYPEADDLLEEIIADHSVPKKLAVVSSDRRVQAAARRRGCLVHDSQPWLDALLDGKFAADTPAVRSAEQGRGVASDEKPADLVDRDEVDRWMNEFGFDDGS